MRRQTGEVVIECVRANIANQEGIDAVVNAANAQLTRGGGVAGAIHDGAGPGLEEECRPLAPIEPGEAVLTGAYNLPNNYVIHVLGPVYGKDRPEEEILKRCYRNALTLAEKHRIRSIAFPAISTGAFGYPLRDAARTALSAVAGMGKELRQVRLIRFVLFCQEDLRVHEEFLERATAEN